MTKNYAQLLGGQTEDYMFTRYDIKRAATNTTAIEGILERSEQVGLAEIQVDLGLLDAFLDFDYVPRIRIPFSMQAEDSSYKLSPWAVTQLSEKMGMGAAGYLKKCITAGLSDLFVENLNAWFSHNSGKLVILRVHPDTNTLRAVVSDRYGFFDHIDVAESVADVLSNYDGSLQIESSLITPDNMMLRIVDPTKVAIPGVGNSDGSTIGMSIRNGQTGMYCAEIQFMIYTWVCSNGLIIGTDQTEVYRRKHYNINREEFKEGFARSIEKFPDYIAATHRILERSRQLQLSDIFLSPNDVSAYVKRHTKLSANQVEVVSSIQEAAWDSSIWGLSGAITQFAQTQPATVQHELERIAGNIIQDGLRMAA